MFRSLATLCLLLSSTQALSYNEKLNLANYPSTYLRDCNGIAYIYKAERRLKLGIRAVKNCSRIQVNDTVYKMEKYALGFRFETEIHRPTTTQVTLFSKRGYRDNFIIESPKKKKHRPDEQSHNHRRDTDRQAKKTKRSLAALQLCSEKFSFSSVKEHCHSTIQRSPFNIEPIVSFCATKPGSQHQKRCLDDSLRFSYQPTGTMKLCAKHFPMSSSYQQCIESSIKYQEPPLTVINQCSEMYPQNSKRLNCIDRLSQSRQPEKQLALLSQCADTFFPSDIEQCYREAAKIKKRRSQTLEACSQNFFQPSNKLRCLSASVGIRGGADEVVQQCAKSHFQTSKKLSCIEGFST